MKPEVLAARIRLDPDYLKTVCRYWDVEIDCPIKISVSDMAKVVKWLAHVEPEVLTERDGRHTVYVKTPTSVDGWTCTDIANGMLYALYCCLEKARGNFHNYDRHFSYLKDPDYAQA